MDLASRLGPILDTVLPFSLIHDPHPIAIRRLFRYGLHEIAQIASAIEFLGLEDLMRLQDPEQFDGAVAEYLVAHFLTKLWGLQPVREPGPQHEKSPDWVFRVGDDVHLAVEVKRLSESAVSRARVGDAASMIFAIQNAAFNTSASGWRLTFRGRTDDVVELQAAIRTWAERPRRGVVSRRRGVEVRASRDRGDRVVVDGDPIERDDAREVARVRGVLRDGARQTRGYDGQVVVIVDPTRLLSNYTCEIERLLGEDDVLRDLDAVGIYTTRVQDRRLARQLVWVTRRSL